VLRLILESKWKEATRGCRKLLNEELRNLYSSQDNFWGDHIKENEMGGIYSTDGRYEKSVIIIIIIIIIIMSVVPLET
jgi:hypothetical protein